MACQKAERGEGAVKDECSQAGATDRGDVPPGRLTQLLASAREGNAEAEADVIRLAYDELRRLAGHVAGGQKAGVLRPTSLIHEAWLKLHGKLDGVHDREHFFALAVRAMRQILVDEARARKRVKRGGQATLVSISHEGDVRADRDARASVDVDVEVLAEALAELRGKFARHAAAFELRVLGGLTYTEIGEHLGLSESTARGDVQFARAWLLAKVDGGGDA